MQIKPCSNYLLVLPDKAEETVSGIIVPESVRQRPLRGTVKATGPGLVDEPMEIKVNDVVAYGQHSGIPVENEGVEYLVMKASDVFYVLE